MPLYTFRHNDTNEEFVMILKMSEREKFIADNNVTQVLTPILLHSGRGMSKPDDGFRDVLREIKKNNSRGITRSSVNTF
jgi:hypothetical protein